MPLWPMRMVHRWDTQNHPCFIQSKIFKQKSKSQLEQIYSSNGENGVKTEWRDPSLDLTTKSPFGFLFIGEVWYRSLTQYVIDASTSKLQNRYYSDTFLCNGYELNCYLQILRKGCTLAQFWDLSEFGVEGSKRQNRAVHVMSPACAVTTSL